MTTDGTGALPPMLSRGDTRAARAAVRALAAGLLPRPDVDDVAQEVLCALVFHAGSFDPFDDRSATAARAAFVRRAAARQLAEHERRQARIRIGDRLALDVLPPPATPSAEDLSLSLAPILMLRRALARLGEAEPALHAVLELSADGAPMTAAAARLGIPDGTASSRLRRARAAVRAFFRRETAAHRAARGRA